MAASVAEDIIPGARVLLENAKRTSALRLSGLTITVVPQDVWSIGAALTRLDLGYNKLVALPPAIASLTGAPLYHV